jgi:N-acetylneuraminic acid mutarotase
MNKNIRFAAFLLVVVYSSITAQNFTWMKGFSVADQKGVYGTIGLSSPLNNPGGRQGAVTWQDGSGNFWLFGGFGYDNIGNAGQLNDLWKYNVTANQWTWVSGSDVFIQLGIYGTLGTPSSTNCPGARANAVGWTDGSGNLWLFGGRGYEANPTFGHLNDLWKFNVTTKEWTWMGGSDHIYQTATYGTIGTGSSSNIPGARAFGQAWKDIAGNMWLFGGTGITTNSLTLGKLNDLWKYDPVNNEWTWVNGSNLLDQPGTYGTLGTAGALNTPGGRESSRGWVDANGNFWLFGGTGYDVASTSTGKLNDLWKYNASANQWTWLNGSNVIDQAGVYGTQTVPTATNFPGSREASATWIDGVGNCWLFGGLGFATSTVNTGSLNDLWKYNTAQNQWTWIKGSNVLSQQGALGTMGLPSANNIPGGRELMASWIDPATNRLWLFGGMGQPGTGSAGQLGDLWQYTNCYINPIVINITSSDSLICKGENAVLSAIGSNNFTWSTGTFSSSILVAPAANTTYTVYTADNAGCTYMATYTQIVDPCLAVSGKNEAFNLSIYPNPNNGSFILKLENAEATMLVFDALGRPVQTVRLHNGTNEVNTSLATGLYYFKIKDGNLAGKFIVSE